VLEHFSQRRLMNSHRQIAVLVEFGPLLHWARLLSATLYRNLCGLNAR